MKKAVIFILLANYISSACYSQGQGNTWIFGDSAGVHFAGGQPVAISSSINSRNECSSSISDNTGNLLFYNGGASTSGAYCCTNVWDRNHQLMPNGTQLKGNGSVTQGSLILPIPDDSLKYYVFNISQQIIVTQFHSALYYSIVDMAMNNGMGDVSLKNVLLCDTIITEKMIGVRHANGRDWWVITRQSLVNNFYLYLITPYGINGPNIQTIGNSIVGHLGQLAATQDGSKIVMSGDNRELSIYDFDRCTGTFSNYIQLGDPDTTFTVLFKNYGCSFSHEGEVLYASTYDSLFQYDLTAANIKATKTLMAAYPGASTGDVWIGQHQLGPDGKIYIGMIDYNASFCDSLRTHLSVINSPHILGSGCDFAPYSFPLLPCKGVLAGLPNMPNYNLGRLVGSVCDTVTVVNDLQNHFMLNVFPNPVKDVFTITAKHFNNAHFSIYDITGRILLQQPFSENATVNVDHLKAGIYLIEVSDQKEKSVKGKLIIESH